VATDANLVPLLVARCGGLLVRLSRIVSKAGSLGYLTEIGSEMLQGMKILRVNAG